MFLNIIVTLTFAGCLVNGQIYTVNCPSLNPNISTCNSDTPIADMPTINTGNVLSPSYLNLTILCSSSRLADFKTLSTCVLNSYRHCGDNDYKKLVPTATAYKEAVDYACANIGPINHVQNCLGDSVTECIRNREAREEKTSGAMPDISQPFDEIAGHFCDRKQIALECARDDEDVLACLGSGTWDIYYEYMMKMKPVGCGAASLVITTSLLLVSAVSSFIKYI